MGDVAMTVPVLQVFKKTYPDVKITVLTRGFFSPFFEGIPELNVVSAKVKDEHKGVIGLYKLAKEIRALKIDAIADLHNVLRSNILKFFLRRIPCQQIDKGREEKKRLIKTKSLIPLKSTHQRYADVFNALGFKLDLKEFKAPKPLAIKDGLSSVLSDVKTSVIGIAPFAQYPSKMYPLEQMKEVIAALSKTYSVLLFGGGKAEAKVLQELDDKYDSVHNLVGKYSLKEELALISHLKVMVAMDSGNAHMAAMMGVKVITLWGVTHPCAGFYPFNQNQTNALLADREKYPLIPTSIYGNKYPEGYEACMESITTDSVIAKVEELVS